MTKRDRIAELGRQEHEDREEVRRKRKKQRGFKTAPPIPRSIRAHRYAEKPDTPEKPAALKAIGEVSP